MDAVQITGCMLNEQLSQRLDGPLHQRPCMRIGEAVQLCLPRVDEAAISVTKAAHSRTA